MLFVILLLLLKIPHASAQNIFFNRVSAPAGKPFVHVTGIVQDKQGYMWFASKNGLFRYDGYTMKQYHNDPLNQNSLTNDALECICIDRNGIIWIGTFSAGLERFDPEKETFTHFKHDPADPSSISNDSVSVVFSDRNGVLWVGSNCLDRLNMQTGKFTHYRHEASDKNSISSDHVRAIYEDKKGELWIGTGTVYGMSGGDPLDGGLNKMDRANGTFTRYMHDPDDPHSLASNKVRAIFEDSKGNFWVGTSDDGLHTMNRSTGTFERYPYDARHPEKLSRPALKQGPYYDHITFITEDANGAIWIGTAESGLNYYDPVQKRVRHFEKQNDSAGTFTDYSAWWAYTSREGVLWISSMQGTLYRINPRQGSIPFYPIESKGTTDLFTDRYNDLWIGTDTSGIIVKDPSGKIIKAYKHNTANRTSLTSNDINCITGDQQGTIWAGTYGSGLNRLSKEKGDFEAVDYDTVNRMHFGHNVVLTIYPDPDLADILWIGTFRGLDRFNKRTGAFKQYLFYPDDQDEFGPNAITDVLKDSRSTWWAASWEKGGVHRFDPQTGRSKTYLRGASVTRLIEDHTGVIWVASREGLFRLDREKDAFIRFEDLSFLSEANEITNLIEDNTGNLWATTTTGIVRINPRRDESTLFGKSYGVNGPDFYYLASGKNKEGKLFFGARSGYYSFFPGEVTQKKRPPEILITSFRISNKPVAVGKSSPLTTDLSSVQEIRLAYDQNIFSFDFLGIDYSNPEENRQLFMLENYDAGWNLAGSERKAIYFNVPPGKYIFHVKVVNSFGVWAERSIRIIITPPWWSTWWFRIGAIVLVLSLLYLLVRWRVRQKFDRQLERSEQDKQLAELMQKTGELEMQALRAQMNPHFIFNSLNAINRFILENNKTQASGYLTKFSRLVRIILQNSQSALIALESELESLTLYLELEAMRFDHRFSYHVSIPEDLDTDLIKVPPLIIQPYAENAIWHGLMHKEDQGRLDITLTKEQDHLLISVRDDGIGRKQAMAMTSKSATRHKSLGLKITADRIAMMQRFGKSYSSVTVNDLAFPDGSAAGTEVLIKIPIVYDRSNIGG